MSSNHVSVIVVGGCAVDEGYRACSPTVTGAKMLETSTPCNFLFRSPGGVGRNLADVLRKLLPRATHSVSLLSAVGAEDPESRFLLERCEAAGLRTQRSVARLRGEATAKYVAILDGRGDLATAAAAMSIFESGAFLKHIRRVGAPLIRRASAVVIDSNLPAEHFALAFSLATTGREPTLPDAIVDAASPARRPSAISSALGIIPRLFFGSGSPDAAGAAAAASVESFGSGVKIVAIDPISVEKGRRCVSALFQVATCEAASAAAAGPSSPPCYKNIIRIMKPNNHEAAAMVDELSSRLAASESSAFAGYVKSVHKQIPCDGHRVTGAGIFSAPPSLSTAASVQAANQMAAEHHGDVCHPTLHTATKNAVLLVACLRFDIVVVSCGQHGSIACFRNREWSSDEETAAAADKQDDETHNSSSDTTVLRFSQNWKRVRVAASCCYFRWFPPLRIPRVEKVTGAGDTFLGSLVSYLLLALTNVATASSRGQAALASTAHNSEFSSASLHAVQAAVKQGTRCWAQLPREAKGALITSAVARASRNSILALSTSKGAIPRLHPMLGSKL